MRHGRSLAGLSVAIALCGCGEPKQLYIAHNTVVGLDVAVDTNRQAGRLVVGYDRQFVALAPKSVPHKNNPAVPDPECDDKDECREPMAALSCNEVEVETIFLTRFKDRLATGTAAKIAAKTMVGAVKKDGADSVTTDQAIRNQQLAYVFFDCWTPDED